MRSFNMPSMSYTIVKCLVMIAALGTAACGGSGSGGGKTVSTDSGVSRRGTAGSTGAPSTVADTGMGRMDHSTMAMPGATPAAGSAPKANVGDKGVASSPPGQSASMAGMHDMTAMPTIDRSGGAQPSQEKQRTRAVATMPRGHESMPGMPMPKSKSADAGVGHDMSRMSTMTGMRRMSGMTDPRDTNTSVASSHDMANMTGARSMAPMPGMNTPPMAPDRLADATLMAIAAHLLEDPVVRRLIESDSTLRRAWANPQVRRILGSPRPE